MLKLNSTTITWAGVTATFTSIKSDPLSIENTGAQIMASCQSLYSQVNPLAASAAIEADAIAAKLGRQVVEQDANDLLQPGGLNFENEMALLADTSSYIGDYVMGASVALRATNTPAAVEAAANLDGIGEILTMGGAAIELAVGTNQLSQIGFTQFQNTISAATELAETEAQSAINSFARSANVALNSTLARLGNDVKDLLGMDEDVESDNSSNEETEASAISTTTAPLGSALLNAATAGGLTPSEMTTALTIQSNTSGELTSLSDATDSGQEQTISLGPAGGPTVFTVYSDGTSSNTIYNPDGTLLTRYYAGADTSTPLTEEIQNNPNGTSDVVDYDSSAGIKSLSRYNGPNGTGILSSADVRFSSGGQFIDVSADPAPRPIAYRIDPNTSTDYGHITTGDDIYFDDVADSGSNANGVPSYIAGEYYSTTSALQRVIFYDIEYASGVYTVSHTIPITATLPTSSDYSDDYTQTSDLTVTFQSDVYDVAVPNFSASIINLGVVHVGATANGSISVSNVGVAGALTDVLITSPVLLNDGQGTSGFSIGLNSAENLAPGQTGTIDVSYAATKAGTRLVTLQVYAQSHDSQLPDQFIGDGNTSIEAEIYNYAVAKLTGAGAGAFSQGGAPNEWTLDFGDIAEGGKPSAETLDILNAAPGGTLAAYSDLLSGNYSINGTGFTVSGVNGFTDLAAGQSAAAITVSVNTQAVGLHSETLTVTPVSSDSGGSWALAPITLVIEDDVVSSSAGKRVSRSSEVISAPGNLQGAVLLTQAMASFAPESLSNALALTFGSAGNRLLVQPFVSTEGHASHAAFA